MTTLTLNEQERQSVLHALSMAADDYSFDHEESKAQIAMALWRRIATSERECK